MTLSFRKLFMPGSIQTAEVSLFFLSPWVLVLTVYYKGHAIIFQECEIRTGPRALWGPGSFKDLPGCTALEVLGEPAFVIKRPQEMVQSQPVLNQLSASWSPRKLKHPQCLDGRNVIKTVPQIEPLERRLPLSPSSLSVPALFVFLLGKHQQQRQGWKSMTQI